MFEPLTGEWRVCYNTHMRICNVCKEEKPLEDFRNCKVRKLGKEYTCILCKRKREAEWRSENRELIKEKQRVHYRKNRKEISAKRKQNYDPIKNKARWLARKIRQQECILCDKKGERHHEDYSKPLDIVFLCKSHHKQVHDGTLKL